MRKKRKSGGMVDLKDDPDGEREAGEIGVVSGKKKVLETAKKTSSDGFKAGGAAKRKDGGAISGAASMPSLAKRARGGRTTAPFSGAGSTSERSGSSTSGHEGE